MEGGLADCMTVDESVKGEAECCLRRTKEVEKLVPGRDTAALLELRGASTMEVAISKEEDMSARDASTCVLPWGEPATGDGAPSTDNKRQHGVCCRP